MTHYGLQHGEQRSVLIVAPFVSLPGEPGFNRFLYLATTWAEKFRVTLVTSSFCHALKKQRDPDTAAWRELPFDLVLLYEPGYRQNVSFARFASHWRFTRNFRLWLAAQAADWRFDAVYSAYPLIATNLALAESVQRPSFKLVIDVQDVWPESIAAAFPFLGQLGWFLRPLARRAERAYRAADGLVAVSRTFLARARSHCPQTPGLVIYIGADKNLVDSIPAAEFPPGPLRLVYVGALSHSYDVGTIVSGVNRLRPHYPELELHILGDGPHRKKIQAAAGDGVIFHGFLPYEEMVAIAKGCDLAINPIVASAETSITNKLSDYFVMGLPILSSQRTSEVVELVSRAGGDHYEAGNVASFCNSLERFMRGYNREKFRTLQAEGEMFDRSATYPRITSFVQSICERACI